MAIIVNILDRFRSYFIKGLSVAATHRHFASFLAGFQDLIGNATDVIGYKRAAITGNILVNLISNQLEMYHRIEFIRLD